MIFNLSDDASVIHEYLFEMRDATLQQDRLRFRLNTERIGNIVAYEISKKLRFRSDTVITPLGKAAIQRIEGQPVLVTILRAGLPFLNGFLHIFDKADVGFMGAYRSEGETEVKINLEYAAIPPLDDRTLIVIDPMLATGKSMVNSVRLLLTKGKPDFIHVGTLIAAPEGIRHVTQFLEASKISFTLWAAAIDEKLNAQSYIVPGLGDAGDLSFGIK
jgi:uracil phosphoribosyltransferase